MAIQQITVHIHIGIVDWNAGEVRAYPWDQHDGYKLIGTTTFDFDVPEVNLVNEQINHIKSKIENMTEEFYQSKSMLEQKIQDLLCIENTQT